MRYIDLEKHLQVRKRISLHTGLTYSVPFAVILFLLSLGGGFFSGLLFGILSGGFLFALIYLIREMTHRGVERKRKKLSLDAPVLDVTFQREIGLLELQEDKLVYHTLTPGGAEKDFEIPMHENQYISVGQIKQTRLQRFIHKDIELGFILTKQMPNGIPRQFIFYNIDNVYATIEEKVNSINRFELQE